MHAIKVLREDHTRIEALLEELAGTGTDAHVAKARLFERLEKELTVHILAEDNIFLPQVEDAVADIKKTTAKFFDDDRGVLEDSVEMIVESYESHQEIKALLEYMQGLEAEDEEWSDASRLLRRTITLQIEREEDLFPKAEKVLEEEDFERIGDLIEHCKWQVRGLAQARLASSSSFRQSLVKEASLLVEKEFQDSKRE